MSGAQPDPHRLLLPNETRSVSQARHAVRAELDRLGMGMMSHQAAVVVTELVSNAVLYTEGPVQVEVRPVADGVRLRVSDTSSVVPVVPTESDSAMTGRGLLLVRSVASRFGFEQTAGGKTVWADLESSSPPTLAGAESVVEDWSTGPGLDPSGVDGRYRIELGRVPTDLLLAAKSHVDNLVREFALASTGAASGTTAAVPAHLAELIETVVNRFSEARTSIKRQAIQAAYEGLAETRLRLDLRPDAASAAQDYLSALDEVDAYCRAARLLTLETPPKHRVFRRWYIGEIVEQLRRSQAGHPPGPGQSFEEFLLAEIDNVAAAEAAADRAARMYRVAAALSGATTPEEVAAAVLTEGAAALGASGGGILLLSENDRLTVPGTVGYEPRVVETLRAERVSAELLAAVALRTGEAVWLESRDQRDARFPGLVGMERGTISLCAVPLLIGQERIGALRFSFSESRLFGDDERRFVLALAAQTGQALDRARLYRDRVEFSTRLQRSLLPPALPHLPGVDLAAVYHPLGDGVEVGGDFYDVWAGPPGQWFFALGDVCGTGPDAAGVTALVRYSLRAVTRLQPDIPGAMAHLNQILIAAAQSDTERFCTVVAGAVVSEGETVRVTFSTRGHPGPLLRRADGSLGAVNMAGTLLGTLDPIQVVTEEVVLAPGDSLVLFTDGVVEARDGGGFFGTEGLMASLRQAPSDAARIAAAVEADVLAHSGGVLRDDLAVMVIQPSASRSTLS